MAVNVVIMFLLPLLLSSSSLLLFIGVAVSPDQRLLTLSLRHVTGSRQYVGDKAKRLLR